MSAKDEPTINIDGNVIKVRFDNYGVTHFTITLDSNGLVINERFTSKRDGNSESSIGVTAVDQHTIRVDAV